jgi:hypothetical protein
LFTTGISSTKKNIFQPPVTHFPCAGIAGQWSVQWTASIVCSYRWLPECAIYHSLQCMLLSVAVKSADHHDWPLVTSYVVCSWMQWCHALLLWVSLLVLEDSFVSACSCRAVSFFIFGSWCART